MLKTNFRRCIYQSPSGFRVYQNACYRWLTFGNTFLQTLIHRRHPERAGLEYIRPLVQMVRTFPGDCCLLGLGGAGIAHALTPFLTDSRMIAVDNSEDVIDIAARYFMTDDIPHLTTVHQSADEFVQSTTAVYQHILVDLHDANDFPLACNNDAFFAHCKALLKPEGILTVNLLHLHKSVDLFQRIRQQFDQCTIVVPVKGTTNTLVFAFNRSGSADFLPIIQQINFLKNVIWDEAWGLVGQ